MECLDKFKDRYRIPSARWPHWDYAMNGVYFITINTRDNSHFFGEIIAGEMQLSTLGNIAHLSWMEIPRHFKQLELGEFVVMPNHVHGILILTGDRDRIIDDIGENDAHKVDAHHKMINIGNTDIGENDARKDDAPNLSGSATCIVSTKNEQMAKISPKSGSVSRIIGSYKSAVTKTARRMGYDFGWQSRFYDHIVRDEQSYENIIHYIINNPRNWEKDPDRGNNERKSI